MLTTMNRALQLERNMHVRALSFSSLPKMILRSFRLPTYALTAATGAFAYANYKVDGEWGAPVAGLRAVLMQYAWLA